MRSRPAYTPCKLYYDADRPVDVGEYLQTPAGSAYLIQAVRQDRKRWYRRHLMCLRWPANEIPAGATVHLLRWYPRKKKRARSLSDLTKRADQHAASPDDDLAE